MTTSHVPTPPTLSPSGVDGYLRSLYRTWQLHPSRPLELNWDDLHQLDDVAGQILASGLLGELADVPLVVRVPAAKSRLLTLARTGVVFALANRSTEITTLEGAHADEFDLPSWRRTWSPSSPSAFDLVADGQAQLFSAAAVGESEYAPNIAGRKHAAFINPHLTDDGVGETTVRGAARPWLRQLLGATGPGGEQIETFIEQTGRLVDELIDNVREHALRGQRGDPSESLVTIAVTEGEKGHLHVTVMDTGRGIAATARPKLNVSGSVTDAVIVEGLLLGRYQGWHNGRGIGLPKVWDVCTQFNGQMFIASNSLRADVGRRGKLRVADGRFSLGGTVVSAALPIPRR